MVITKDGVYPLIKPIVGDNSSTTTVYVSGTFGTASAEFVYYNTDKQAVPLQGGEASSGEQYTIDHGFGVLVYLSVTGSDGATRINVEAGGLD